MSQEQKQSFSFGARKMASIGTQPEDGERIAEALEYIAHYLDRIEGHLSVLASQANSGAKIEQAVNSGLRGLSTAISQAAVRR